MPNVPFVVKVICKGTAQQAHPKRRLARYQWAEDEGVWVRVDQHGSEGDWFPYVTAPGLKAAPRTTLICPTCEQQHVYDHDTLQAMLRQGAGDGALVL
ncbi:hypothetical protein ACFQZV_07305 [Microbacterium koreense]|uniref:DUF3565 domain-containing protein n=1 Tax=Microbacterium koreense TaxID=323761 RepID=A0ABW2ZRD6_9MICO